MFNRKVLLFTGLLISIIFISFFILKLKQSNSVVNHESNQSTYNPISYNEVDISLVESTFTMNGYDIVIRNTGDNVIYTSNWYDLEVFDSGKWYKIIFNIPGPSIDDIRINMAPGPNETRLNDQWTEYLLELTPGTYRIIIEITYKKDDNETYIAFPFEISK